MNKPTVILLKEIIAGLNASLLGSFKNLIDLTGGFYTIEICDSSHLRVGSIIIINLIEYTVREVDANTFTISGAVIPVGTSFTFPEVFYFHGTPLMVGNELNHISDADNKTPFIYLYEVLEDRFDNEIGTSIDRTSEVRLFFLDQSNYKDWDTEHHYSESIIPMSKLAHEFINYLKINKNIGSFPDFSLTYHSNFGIKLNQNGHEVALFNDELSGVELKINIPFKKSLTCDDCY